MLPSRDGYGTGPALRRLVIRQVRRGAIVVALLAGLMSGVVAIQYRATVANAFAGPAMRALTESRVIRILFGQPLGLDNPGGFTVWRTGMPLQVLVAVWALLTATRLTRGEEDSGRWDLLLGGRLRPADLVARYLAALAGAAALIGAMVIAALLAAGTAPVGAVLHGVGIAGTTLLFAAIGALSAQLLPSRSAATTGAVTVLGISFLLRMLADSQDRLQWLAWTTPFGLTEQAAPYTGNRVGPLAVLLAAAGVVAAAGVGTAHHRDVGGAPLAVRRRRGPRTRLLHSIGGFAVRRALRPTCAWGLGIAVFFVIIGALVAPILRFLTENPRFIELADAAGYSGLGSANGLAAAMFGLLAIPVGVFAALRTATIADDEAGRRSTALHALPVSRARLTGTDATVTAAGVFVLLATAALSLWLGSLLSGAPVPLGPALSGAFNTAPVVGIALGAAVFALGWAPHAVTALGTLPVAGGFLLQVLVQTFHGPAWLSWPSPFDHLAPVPAGAVNWTATSWFVVIALTLGAAGLVGHTRRDLLG